MSDLDSLNNFISKFSGLAGLGEAEEYLFYQGTVKLLYDVKAHKYLLVTPDGLEEQDGVTTALGIIDKSLFLVPWGVKVAALKLLATIEPYRVRCTYDCPNDCRGHNVDISYPKFEQLVSEAKKAHKEKLDEAGNIGHIAHAWIEQYIKARIARDDTRRAYLLDHLPENEQAKSCSSAAIDWMVKHNVRWICTEKKIYSRKYKYAGTMDGLCWVDSCTDTTCCPVYFRDRLSLADWKSSNSLHIENVCQTAAYTQAHMEEFPDEKIEDRWIIRLGKTDGEFQTWHLRPEDYEADWQGFHLALELSRSVRDIEQRQKARDSGVKAARRVEAAAAREAALKLACKGSAKYQGKRKPACNGGNPCLMCSGKYLEMQSIKRGE